jgi:hypothetical protein
MSQMPPYPPQGPGYPPPPGNYPPPGGYGAPGYPYPGQTTTSAAAVTSLICGILFCIPGITSLVAVITGIVGLSSTKNPAVKGRGMAIAGLILGILGLLGWGAFGNGLSRYWRYAAPQRTFATTYVNNLVAGNVDADVTLSTDKITQDQLQALSDQAKPWGTLQSSIMIAVPMQTSSSNLVGVVSGICQFSTGQHKCQINLVNDTSGAGQFKVDSFQWMQ